MKDGMKTVTTESWGGVWNAALRHSDEGGLESVQNPSDLLEAGFGRPGVPPIL